MHTSYLKPRSHFGLWSGPPINHTTYDRISALEATAFFSILRLSSPPREVRYWSYLQEASMVRYFPNSWASSEDPPRPSHFPANKLLISGALSGMLGTGLGTMALKKFWSTPTTGLCMRNAAIVGLPIYTFQILGDLHSRRMFQKSLEKENTKTPPIVYFSNLNHMDINDWQIAGGVAA